MVDVNTQNKTISVNVSSSGVSSNVNASGDTTLYYSNKAREWAISDRIVDNVDYSSKYYAEKSKESAQASLENKEASEHAIEEINTIRDNTLTEITTEKENSILEIKDTTVTQTNEIENASQVEQNKIKDLGIDTRADIDLSNLSEEGKKKIGGGGLEIGDIGIAPLGIDESQNKRRYLNGQIIIQEQFVSFTEKLKNAIALYPSLACSEDEWQTKATMTVSGQVGKFVIDDAQGTIRLPRIIMPIQGLTDLSKLAEIVEAGLPNITGSFTKSLDEEAPLASNSIGTDGAITLVKDQTTGYNTLETKPSANRTFGFTIDASLSNPIYGNSDTVQQEQIQYPYFIQVATGVEESIDTTRATEIITPYFLGMSQYFEVAPNNPSWLKSQGQYNSKAVYPDYYDWLLKIYNGTETQEGVSVKLATESYTDYDFVINQTDETFRFPLLNGSEAIVSDRVQDFGNPTSGTNHIAPANGWFNIHRTATANNQYVYLGTNEITKQSESVASGTNLRVDIEVKRGDSVFVSYNAPTAGYFRFIYAKGNGDLYYYVGEGIVNPQLVNVARIEEIKANRTDVDGQWVYNFVQLLSSASFSAYGTRTIDLSVYLPNDGHDYEVFVVCSGVTGKTAGNGVHIMCTTGSSVESNITAFFGQAYVSVANQIQVAQSSHTLPVFANDKAITISQGLNFACTVNCSIQGYRRLGKNV